MTPILGNMEFGISQIQEDVDGKSVFEKNVLRKVKA